MKKMKRHHFLTHAHKDHIVARASYPIYSTLLTTTLLLQFYSQLYESVFAGVEVGQSLVIENHCPGAVPFLFEGTFGNIFHAGDCRLTPECLPCLRDKYIGKKGKEPRCPFGYVFLKGPANTLQCSRNLITDKPVKSLQPDYRKTSQKFRNLNNTRLLVMQLKDRRNKSTMKTS